MKLLFVRYLRDVSSSTSFTFHCNCKTASFLCQNSINIVAKILEIIYSLKYTLFYHQKKIFVGSWCQKVSSSTSFLITYKLNVHTFVLSVELKYFRHTVYDGYISKITRQIYLHQNITITARTRLAGLSKRYVK